jgi:hypothetical protein
MSKMIQEGYHFRDLERRDGGFKQSFLEKPEIYIVQITIK